MRSGDPAPVQALSSAFLTMSCDGKKSALVAAIQEVCVDPVRKAKGFRAAEVCRWG